jgi:hypothetical protein
VKDVITQLWRNNVKFLSFVFSIFLVQSFCWSQNDSNNNVAKVLNASLERFREYTSQRKSLVESICHLTPIDGLFQECLNRFNREINLGLRELSKQSHVRYPLNHNSYDIGLEDGIQLVDSVYIFYEDFAWDRYPTLLPLQELSRNVAKFDAWRCERADEGKSYNESYDELFDPKYVKRNVKMLSMCWKVKEELGHSS